MKNWFVELNSVDVNEHIKQKNGMDYLSWMWAWQELKKRYPLSYSTIHETPEGMLVWRDPVGCHVKTSVTIVWEEDDGLHEHTATEYLPCMDFKNRTVEYDAVDAMLVNKTIQRSLTKCIARLGIGGYLFSGEDLPEDATKLLELQAEVKKIATKKSAISDKTEERTIKLCKEAEKEANPDLDDEFITGKVSNIKDIDMLETLKKKLLAIRK